MNQIPKTGVKLCCVGSAGFPACGFWRLSSRQFPNGNTGLESPVNPQTGMSALHQFASVVPLFIFRICVHLCLVPIIGSVAKGC